MKSQYLRGIILNLVKTLLPYYHIDSMKRILVYLAMVFVSVGFLSTMSPLVPSAAAKGEACNNVRFLTFPAWYRGLADGKVPDCDIKSPGDFGSEFDKGLTTYITIIVLNVVEIMLQLVVYICAGFIIWGGFMYLISTGSSDKITSGKKMIQNAVIGLVISLVAVIAVSFIVTRIGI